MFRVPLARRLRVPITAAALLVSASGAHAQGVSAPVDARFQPWLGCWRPLDTGLGLEELDSDKQPTRACVMPSSTVARSVDIVLYHRDSVMSRTALPLAGSAVPRRIDECEGTERAEWSPDDARLVLKAELSCARGVKRVETGLMTMNDAGQWVQLQHLAVGRNEATSVARFRFDGDGEQAAAGAPRSSRALRVATGGAMGIDEVIATASVVPASLAEAWLSEIGQRLALDAKSLLRLADGGVPPRVIDVMVALANPDRFQIGPAMTTASGASQGPGIVAMRNGRTGGGGMGGVGMGSRCQMMDDLCYGPGGLGAWGFGYRFGMLDPWGFGYFNPYRFGGGPWGFNAFSPWGGGWGGGFGPGVFWGGGPVVIVPNGGSGGDASGPVRGRAVRGGGYTRSTPQSGSGSGIYSPASPSGGGGGVGGGSMGGMGGGGASSGSSDGGARTAKPRGSGGR